jgi:hypothetical protein
MTSDILDLIRTDALLESDNFVSDELLEAELKEALDVNTIDEDLLDVTEESVRIFNDAYGNYVLEYYEVLKLAEAKDCSTIDALESLAEYYNEQGANINANNFAVVVESDDFFEEAIYEAKCGNKKKKSKIKKSLEDIDELKEKGVKIIKKKSKRSKK